VQSVDVVQYVCIGDDHRLPLRLQPEQLLGAQAQVLEQRAGRRIGEQLGRRDGSNVPEREDARSCAVEARVTLHPSRVRDSIAVEEQAYLASRYGDTAVPCDRPAAVDVEPLDA